MLVRNVTLPEQLQAAITNKLEAEQSALKMKFVIAQQEAEDQKLLEETTRAGRAREDRGRCRFGGSAPPRRRPPMRTRIAAQAAADAKRLDAQATADYEKLVERT